MPFDISQLLDYGIGGLALALIGLVVYLTQQHTKTIKMFMKHDSDNDVRHDKTYRELSNNIKENTELTREVNTFMRGLNGSLRKIAKRKK